GIRDPLVTGVQTCALPISGRRESEGQAVVKAIDKAGGQALFVKTDVSREGDVKALVDKTLATFGRLDFAFNNAGVEGTAGLTTRSEERRVGKECSYKGYP